MKIVLLGYMGSGKTTVGKLLAKKIDCQFLDLDLMIENKVNQSTTAIFNDKGELYFRKLEHKILEDTLKGTANYVLSVGGGTPCYYNHMEQINANAKSVYLQTGIVSLHKRLILEKEQRPLISHLKDTDLKEFIAKHLFERSQFYLQATHILKTDSKSVLELATEIETLLI